MKEKSIYTLLCILSSNCPLKCKMCFNWRQNETEQVRGIDIKEAIGSMCKGNCFRDDATIVFSGGEALLRNDVFDLIKFVKEKGMCPVLITSGAIYNEHVSGKIKESGVTYIGLSLDSLIAEKHDYLRGRQGVFRNVLKIIEEHPKKVNLTCTVSAYNVEEVPKIAQWVYHNDNILSITFQAIVKPFYTDTVPQKNWFGLPNFSHLWPRNLATVNKNLDKLIKLTLKKNHKIHTSARHLAFFKEYFRNPNEIHREAKCRVGDYSLTITSKGGVMLCGYMEDLGNIREKSISDILSGPKTDELRRDMLECNKACEFFVNCFFEDK